MFDLNSGLLFYLQNNVFRFENEWQVNLLELGFVLFGIIAAYLLGSINTAIVVSKLFYKDDIRRYGSGNAGLTNMLRTYGKKAAGVTLLGDVLKTVISIVIMAVLLGFRYYRGMSLGNGYCYVAGMFAVIGHVFPIYYGFKGGKGVLATSAIALVLSPIPFLILISIFILVVALSKYVSLGSVTVAVLYPVVINGYIKIFFGGRTPGLISLCTILLAIFIVWCHRENLERISNRTERKISFKKKEKELTDGSAVVEKSDEEK